jgi:C-terminal processing protease CtpA/Prc
MKRIAEINFRKTLAGLALGGFIVFAACNEDDNSGENKYVNNWIYDNMEVYYLWNADLPSSPGKSKAPDEFFNSLLSEEDRFSWIQEDYIELLNSLQGVNKEAGYEFKLYLESEDNENIIAQVMYIKAGSPVETEGKDLMRGDVITHINGDRMTTSNYQKLLAEISESHTIQYLRPTETGLEDKGTLTLNTTEFAENPNFMSKIIDTGDGHKIGYYVYNFFAVGPTSTSSQYNNEMDAIFSEFKSEGITDLVVDLRYNSGGAEGATINLASLIGDNIDNSITFTRRQYNNELQAALINDPDYGYDFLIKKFTAKSANVGSLLNNGRVYILTSSRTASASELLINGLKPHMDVFLIGDVTVGKNVGSISIYEDDDPKNTWGMQPIVVKSYNSANESNYSDGFVPNISNLDNDIDLRPIGDEDEILLSLAIEHITGGSGARKDVTARSRGMKSLGTSADFKRGSYNLVIDDERLKGFMKSSLVE